MLKKSLLVLALLVLLGVLVVGCKMTRAGYESAPYQVVSTRGHFEVRDYPELRLVETKAGGADADNSFNRLFRFITGKNEAKQKIAMTTPVFMENSATNSTMAFVLPAKLGRDEVPRPSDASVRVRNVSARRFAVWRFSGGRSPANEEAALKKLREELLKDALVTEGGSVFGYFDPPWTPGFLRRNEVMLRVHLPATAP